jgi:hypothetical protein
VGNFAARTSGGAITVPHVALTEEWWLSAERQCDVTLAPDHRKMVADIFHQYLVDRGLEIGALLINPISKHVAVIRDAAVELYRALAGVGLEDNRVAQKARDRIDMEWRARPLPDGEEYVSAFMTDVFSLHLAANAALKRLDTEQEHGGSVFSRHGEAFGAFVRSMDHLASQVGLDTRLKKPSSKTKVSADEYVKTPYVRLLLALMDAAPKTHQMHLQSSPSAFSQAVARARSDK